MQYLRHDSPNLKDVLDHVQSFLSREFRGRVAKTQNPRLATMTRGANLPGGGGAVGGASGGSGGSTAPAILAGDVTGAANNNKVATLQAVTLTLTSPVTGQVISYSGTAIVNGNTLGALTLTGDLTLSAHNLVTDTVTGTQIGTAATQKLGLFGATPVVRQVGASAAAIAAIADANARSAVTALQNALAALGAITAPP